MVLTKRTLQIIRMIVLLLLWGICAYSVVRLSVDYVNTGRKTTTDIETERINDLSVPWLYTSVSVGKKCFLEFEGCEFLKSLAEKYVNCSTAIDKLAGDDESYIINSLSLRKLGIRFTNPYDNLKLSFTVRYRDTGELVNPRHSIVSSCNCSSSDSAMEVALLGDDIIMSTMIEDGSIDELDRAAPVFIRFGNVASISYKLSQQQYLNNTIKNSTECMTTQFRDDLQNETTINILPASFDITKIKHKPGQSFLDLLGSIFGWIGVFTGACIFSVIEAAITFYGKTETYNGEFFERVKEDFVTIGELSEYSKSESIVHDIIEEVRMLRAEINNLKFQASVPSLFTSDTVFWKNNFSTTL